MTTIEHPPHLDELDLWDTNPSKAYRLYALLNGVLYEGFDLTLEPYNKPGVTYPLGAMKRTIEHQVRVFLARVHESPATFATLWVPDVHPDLVDLPILHDLAAGTTLTIKHPQEHVRRLWEKYLHLDIEEGE